MALEEYSLWFAAHFETARAQDFADMAFTLQTGRKQMAQRGSSSRDSQEAAEPLRKPNPSGAPASAARGATGPAGVHVWWTRVTERHHGAKPDRENRCSVPWWDNVATF